MYIERISSDKHYKLTAPFWDGKDRAGKQLEFHDDEAKKYAISRAYRDLMARTLKRTTVEGNIETSLHDALLPKLKEWFDKEPNDIGGEIYFDKWHQKASTAVLQTLQKYYTNQDGTPVQYGKAQKIVNMTMKGLYCLNGADERETHFTYCHMALDSFTLEWFCRNVMPEAKEENGKKIVKRKMVAWSIIPEVGNENVYGYSLYVKWIRECRAFKPNNAYETLTPFQAEFCIWPEIQLELAAEAFYGQEIGKNEAMIYADEYLENHKELGEQWIEKLKNTPEDKKFQKYKEMFKGLSIDAKMEFLQSRVSHFQSIYSNMLENSN